MAVILFSIFFFEILTLHGHPMPPNPAPRNPPIEQWTNCSSHDSHMDCLPSDQPPDPIEFFKEFVSKFNKQYAIGSEEFNRRFGIFKQSLDRVKKLSLKDPSYGITHFADLTVDEFQSSRLFLAQNAFYKDIRSYFNPLSSEGLNKAPTSTEDSTVNYNKIRRWKKRRFDLKAFLSSLGPEMPKKVDWREKGIISPVINQGKCGACWAYSSLETIESMAVKLNVTPPDTHLSSAQLINCGSLALPDSLKGCEGGDVCAVLSWLKKHKVRIMAEEEYRESGPCVFDHGGVLVSDYECKNYVGREDEMIYLLATHGPLTAAVDATTWQDYLGGTIKYHCETQKTHAVQIVGYNLEDPTPYYIVKNSWGSEFGLNGYLHIAIGSNLCGIAEDVSSIDVTA